MKFRLKLFHRLEKDSNTQFLSLLDKKANLKVVDLGCGNGDFTLKVKEKIQCNEITGIDIHETSLMEAAKKGIKVLKMDLNMPFKLPSNSFDVVISNQVIEHILNLRNFVTEIYRILNSNGYAVISTENLSSWENIFALFFGYSPFSMNYDKIKIGNPFSARHGKVIKGGGHGHLRIFTYQSLIDFFKHFNFRIEKVVGSGHFLKSLSKVDPKHTRFLTIKVRK